MCARARGPSLRACAYKIHTGVSPCKINVCRPFQLVRLSWLEVRMNFERCVISPLPKTCENSIFTSLGSLYVRGSAHIVVNALYSILFYSLPSRLNIQGLKKCNFLVGRFPCGRLLCVLRALSPRRMARIDNIFNIHVLWKLQ